MLEKLLNIGEQTSVSVFKYELLLTLVVINAFTTNCPETSNFVIDADEPFIEFDVNQIN